MAMDKEKLLAYFQKHYLSRQEVLFKLPLNVSIDSFWPELLNRRKAGATILPLNNARGMPYWYVLTDKMIAASEKLCAEAMELEESIDPYRTPMTSAMTEEMFFTSFVEGAQIPLQEAMNFLQRGTEPENIQEQMILNNRQAWTNMIGSLYRPLDENFIKTLAFMLTEEMDDCAEDYRQTDQHPIAAMNSEPYEVPPAYSLPDRMAEYYDFLQAGNVHPLIKAAVGQAYILVARPFPEGNERLSRMISSAVLLRSGYDFFRDISISSVIAKENYRYYKCMQEILRAENGGDLTYFIEYYLDLLVRAMESRKEREQRRSQEFLIREREMAHEPLQDSSEQMPLVDDIIAEEKGETHPEKSPQAFNPKLIQSADSFMERVRKLKFSPNSEHRTYPAKVQRMMEKGLTRFSVRQWSDVQGIDPKDADLECKYLYHKGLADRHLDVSPIEYSFRFVGASEDIAINKREAEAQSKQANKSSPVLTEEFEEKLRVFEQSKSTTKQRSAATVRKLLRKGITTFYRQEWADYAHLSMAHAKDACDAMIACDMIINTTPSVRPSVYRFNLPERSEQAESQTPMLTDQLKAMLKDKTDHRAYRIGTFLLEMIEKGYESFTAKDWGERFKITKAQYGNDIRRALNMGLVTKHVVGKGRDGVQYVYKICKMIHKGIRSDNLTEMQRGYLRILYDEFAGNEFSVDDMTRLMQIGSASSAQFHLHNFMERGILTIKRQPGKKNKYIFAISSQENPECFTQAYGPIEPSKQEKDRSEMAMKVARTIDLTATA